jgi:hypothetical protein
MTHSLHRRGTAEDLHEDYVVIVKYSRQVMREDTQDRMRRTWEILSRFERDLENYGNHLPNWNGGPLYTMEQLQKMDSPIIHAVFKDREKLKACMKEIKENNLGLSVVVSGLYDETRAICAELDLKPHTVNQSLGIHGRTELLLEEGALEIHTLCGHAMVSPNLIRHMVKKINEGTITCKDAAKKLSRMCDCGIFNPHRAENLLSGMTVGK